MRGIVAPMRVFFCFYTDARGSDGVRVRALQVRGARADFRKYRIVINYA